MQAILNFFTGTEVTIPASVETIGKYAFTGCYKLDTINLTKFDIEDLINNNLVEVKK